MPAKPQPVTVEEILKAKPERRPAATPEGVWLFPERLALVAEARGLSRQEIASKAHATPGTITRWFQFEGLEALKAPLVCWLEEGLGLPPGTFLGSPKWRNPSGKAADVLAVTDMAMRLGLDKSIIAELSGGGPMVNEMQGFGDNLKRAVLGAVHLLGYPLEAAVPAAKRALAKVGKGATLTAEGWLSEMRPFLSEFGSPGSGTYPSDKFKTG